MNNFKYTICPNQPKVSSTDPVDGCTEFTIPDTATSEISIYICMPGD